MVLGTPGVSQRSRPNAAVWFSVNTSQFEAIAVKKKFCQKQLTMIRKVSDLAAWLCGCDKRAILQARGRFVIFLFSKRAQTHKLMGSGRFSLR